MSLVRTEAGKNNLGTEASCSRSSLKEREKVSIKPAGNFWPESLSLESIACMGHRCKVVVHKLYD